MKLPQDIEFYPPPSSIDEMKDVWQNPVLTFPMLVSLFLPFFDFFFRCSARLLFLLSLTVCEQEDWQSALDNIHKQMHPEECTLDVRVRSSFASLSH